MKKDHIDTSLTSILNQYSGIKEEREKKEIKIEKRKGNNSAKTWDPLLHNACI